MPQVEVNMMEAANKPYPVISVQGTPYDCGKQYGQQTKSLIKENVEYYLDFWRKNQKMNRSDVKDYAQGLIKTVEEFDASLLNEMQGVSDGSDVLLDYIIAMNGRYELSWALPASSRGGCTSIAVLPEATINGETLIAQNWDYRIGLRDTCVFLEVQQEGKPAFVVHTEAGILGHKGMNSAGLGLTVNALVSEQDKASDSVPFLLICRKMLESWTLNEATSIYLKAGRTVSSNVMVVRADGAALDLEGTPFDTSILYPEEGILVHTNHFIGNRSLKVKDEYIKGDASSLYRYSVAQDNMRQRNGHHSTKTLKSVLKNHFDYPYSICLHVDPSSRHDLQEETLTSIIFCLDSRRILASKGPPCQTDYYEYSFQSLFDS